MKNFTIREKQCLGSGSGEKYGSTDPDPMAKYANANANKQIYKYTNIQISKIRRKNVAIFHFNTKISKS